MNKANDVVYERERERERQREREGGREEGRERGREFLVAYFGSMLL